MSTFWEGGKGYFCDLWFMPRIHCDSWKSLKFDFFLISCKSLFWCFNSFWDSWPDPHPLLNFLTISSRIPCHGNEDTVFFSLEKGEQLLNLLERVCLFFISWEHNFLQVKRQVFLEFWKKENCRRRNTRPPQNQDLL